MLSTVKRALLLAPGWRTNRKLLVIQSDDWFAIRTTNRKALEDLKALGADCDRCHYMRNDHFETADDLTALFESLDAVRDRFGRPAVLTANCLSANPDFARIEQSGFMDYHGEPSSTTVGRVSGAESNLELWREAIAKGVCEPQSHGREHLNIQRWMRALQSGADPITRKAFDWGIFGVSGHIVPERRQSFLAAFDTSGEAAPVNLQPVVDDALTSFTRMFGFRSRSFIAPNYVWSDDIEAALQRNGVDYIQSGRAQWYPAANGRHRDRCRRFLGHANAFGQFYLVRNVDFEPSSDPSADWQGRALSQINLAFRLRKPAVISTHRVNFMGGLDAGNRERGLRDLGGLLRAVVKKWPSVEFISTTELGDMIREDGNA